MSFCSLPICATCGPTQAVWVSSHEQCVRCGRVLISCCDGGAIEAWEVFGANDSLKSSEAQEALKNLDKTNHPSGGAAAESCCED